MFYREHIIWFFTIFKVCKLSSKWSWSCRRKKNYEAEVLRTDSRNVILVIFFTVAMWISSSFGASDFLVKNAQMMSLCPWDDIEKLLNCILLTLAWSLYEIRKFDSRTLFIFFHQPTPSLTFSPTDQALAEWRGVLYIYSCVCFCYPFEHSIHVTSGKTEFLTAAGVVNKVTPPLL